MLCEGLVSQMAALARVVDLFMPLTTQPNISDQCQTVQMFTQAVVSCMCSNISEELLCHLLANYQAVLKVSGNLNLWKIAI